MPVPSAPVADQDECCPINKDGASIRNLCGRLCPVHNVGHSSPTFSRDPDSASNLEFAKVLYGYTVIQDLDTARFGDLTDGQNLPTGK